MTSGELRWTIIILVACIIAMIFGIGPYSDSAEAQPLTATQSVTIESTPSGIDAYGMLVIDLAATPDYHAAYIWDRAWLSNDDRYTSHDISVTRYLENDWTATVGWRIKLPDLELSSDTWYTTFGWRWGGN